MPFSSLSQTRKTWDNERGILKFLFFRLCCCSYCCCVTSCCLFAASNVENYLRKGAPRRQIIHLLSPWMIMGRARQRGVIGGPLNLPSEAARKIKIIKAAAAQEEKKFCNSTDIFIRCLITRAESVAAAEKYSSPVDDNPWQSECHYAPFYCILLSFFSALLLSIFVYFQLLLSPHHRDETVMISRS